LLDDGQKAKNNELSSKSTFGGDSTTGLDTSRSVHFCVASRTLERPKIQISYFRARVSELGVCLSVLAAATSATAKYILENTAFATPLVGESPPGPPTTLRCLASVSHNLITSSLSSEYFHHTNIPVVFQL
jgi:hypothetical protein